MDSDVSLDFSGRELYFKKTARKIMWVTVSILAALFWAAFLAATVLPLSSEAALSAALAGGGPAAWGLSGAALGNVLGSG